MFEHIALSYCAPIFFVVKIRTVDNCVTLQRAL